MSFNAAKRQTLKAYQLRKGAALKGRPFSRNESFRGGGTVFKMSPPGIFKGG